MTLKSLFIDYSYYIYIVYRDFKKLMANRGQFSMSIVFGRNKSFRYDYRQTIDEHIRKITLKENGKMHRETA